MSIASRLWHACVSLFATINSDQAPLSFVTALLAVQIESFTPTQGSWTRWQVATGSSMCSTAKLLHFNLYNNETDASHAVVSVVVTLLSCRLWVMFLKKGRSDRAKAGLKNRRGSPTGVQKDSSSK